MALLVLREKFFSCIINIRRRIREIDNICQPLALPSHLWLQLPVHLTVTPLVPCDCRYTSHYVGPPLMSPPLVEYVPAEDVRPNLSISCVIPPTDEPQVAMAIASLS